MLQSFNPQTVGARRRRVLVKMLCLPHLQQQVDDGRLFAGRGHAQVVHDQDSHEVKDVLFGWVVGQGRLGADVTVFRLAAVHAGVPSESLELLGGRTCFIVQITDLERMTTIYKL